MISTGAHAAPGRESVQSPRIKWAKRFTVITLLLAITIPATADEASSLYKKGQDVEARLDYESAFMYYTQAYQLKPKNLTYHTASIRVRVLAASHHVHRGQELREAGHLEEAMAEFQKGALTDPSSFIAQQEIRRTRLILQSAKATGREVILETAENSTDKSLGTASGPVELRAFSTAPITLKLTEDAKVVYTTIGKLAGINVVFDPDLKTQRISVELVRVTLQEALQIVQMESRSFTRPVTTNTIYVAADTPAKRKEIEQNVMMTFYLSNLSQPSDLTDIATSIRSTLDLTRITPMPSQGALIVRGSPDQLTLVQKLIDDMDKARPEVTIEVMVMQVTRERIRQLGIQPPASATLGFLGVSASNGSTPSNGSSSVSLADLTNLAAKDFAVTIPQVTANALFSDSQSKLIQNPQIRALDGQRASLRIGQRYPVATGSFSNGVGGAGISPLVNTQFQYIDIGVNIDITPRVHADNDVTLKLVLDITAVDSLTSIGGITQPIIGQRKIEHEIRLKDGEINLLGGMLEEADAKSLSGLPWLSSIPLLRYFFSSEQTDKRQNELVFVLIPHIVRGQDLNNMNRMELDVGTSNTIELRHLAPTHPSMDIRASATSGISDNPSEVSARSGRNASNLPIQREDHAQLVAEGVPKVIPAKAVKPVLTLNRTGDFHGVHPTSVEFSLSPPESAPLVGETFMVDVLVDGAQNLLSIALEMQYEAAKLELISVSWGKFQGLGDQPVLTSRNDPASGMVQIAASLPAGTVGFSGKGTVVTLCFTAKAAGESIIQVKGVAIKDVTDHVIPANGTGKSVAIRAKV